MPSNNPNTINCWQRLLCLSSQYDPQFYPHIIRNERSLLCFSQIFYEQMSIFPAISLPLQTPGSDSQVRLFASQVLVYENFQRHLSSGLSEPYTRYMANLAKTGLGLGVDAGRKRWEQSLSYRFTRSWFLAVSMSILSVFPPGSSSHLLVILE